MSFTISYWAVVNTSDGTITSTGQTSADTPMVPTGSIVISSDNHATIEAAMADGLQCKLVSGVVRLMPAPVPAVIDLSQIRQSAYVVIDTAAEAARSTFLTPGSGQTLEYERTAADARRLLHALGLDGPVTSFASVRTASPRIGTAQPTPPAGSPATPAAPAPDPTAYPWLAAEQAALASIGVNLDLVQIALSVLATEQGWDEAGAAIKRIRREAKLQVSVAPTADAISTLLTALSYPQATNTGP